MTTGEFIMFEGYAIRPQITSVKNRDYKRYVVDLGTDRDGKRNRRSFSTEAKAQKAIREHIHTQKKNADTAKVLEKRIGEKADKLTTDDLLDAAHAKDILKGVASLVAAARYFMKRNRPGGVNRSTRDIIADYVAEAEADGLRPASIKDMKNRLKRFSNAFGEVPLCQIDKTSILEWSRGDHTAKRDGTPCAPLSRKHYLVVVGGLFNYALDNKLVMENPLESTSKRRRKATGMTDQHMPEIITPGEVQAVLRTAQALEPDVLAPLAIGFFAGVRTTELTLLDWSNISLADKRITITPDIAKKRSVRHIDIADNLLAWLAPMAKESGAITPPPGAWRFKFDRVRKEAGLARWPHNAMRHCFASYYLMKTDDANKTALQLGHRDTNLLFNHYRGLATREDAVKFWAITPKAEDEGVIQYRTQKAS